jgi:hypothetical protein
MRWRGIRFPWANILAASHSPNRNAVLSLSLGLAQQCLPQDKRQTPQPGKGCISPAIRGDGTALRFYSLSCLSWGRPSCLGPTPG